MPAPWDMPEDDDFEYAGDPVDEDVAAAVAAFSQFVALAPDDAELAHLGVAAIVESLQDDRGPDTPTPGMMGVASLIDDALARAALADASPSARETLGDLERVVVRIGPAAASAAAARIRDAVRTANARLGPSEPPA